MVWTSGKEKKEDLREPVLIRFQSGYEPGRDAYLPPAMSGD